MTHSLRHRKSLLGSELDGAAFQIDDELTLNDIKEFVFVVVLVPVKFALKYAKANDTVIHLTERLVKPLFLGFILKTLDIDKLQRVELDVRVN